RTSPPACQVGEAPVAAGGAAVQVAALRRGAGASASPGSAGPGSAGTGSAGTGSAGTGAASGTGTGAGVRCAAGAPGRPLPAAEAKPGTDPRPLGLDGRRASSQAASRAAATSARPIHSHGSPPPSAP